MSNSSVGVSAPFIEAVDESESKNDSDNDPPYQPGQPTTPRSRWAARVEHNTPPQNILNQDGTASDAAKTRLTQRSHHGKMSTRGDELTTLEYAWGVKLGTLNLDTTQNMMWLSPHLHCWFDSGDWALLPPEDDLKKIRDISVDQFTLANKTKFTAVSASREFTQSKC
ncbi:hypothetical protein RSOL_352740, partial [Rhizoctonia solani AG-3 Rhs1AP]